MDEPRTPPAINRRLEIVREQMSARSLREFYNGLRVTNVEGFPSYAAAATYHNSPWRPPSVAYLQAILLKYDHLDGRWLLLGSWPSPAEAAYAKEVERLSREFREKLGLPGKEK